MIPQEEEYRMAMALGSMEAIGRILAVLPPDEQLESGDMALLWQFMAAQLRGAASPWRTPRAIGRLNRNDNPVPA